MPGTPLPLTRGSAICKSRNRHIVPSGEIQQHHIRKATMNVYGKAMTNSKRRAHSKVVEMVLKSKKSNDAMASERQVAAIGS
jgi:hypothetical protein